MGCLCRGVICASLIVSAANAGLAAGGVLVADPFRAVGAKHSANKAKGDFRFLLEPAFFTQTGELAKDPFIADAGIANCRMECKTSGGGAFARTIVLNAVTCRSEDGGVVASRHSLACDEPKAFVSDTVVSGVAYGVPRRFLPVEARLTVTAEKPFSKVSIRHGLPASGCWVDGLEAPAGAKAVRNGGVWDVTLAKAAKEVVLTLRSANVHVKVGDIKWLTPELEARLATHPFFVVAPVRRWSTVGLPYSAVDKSAIDRMAEKYSDTFLGVEVTEWDANYLQKLVRPWSQHCKDLLSAGTVLPCDREQMVANLRHVWESDVAHGGTNIFGMCGSLTFMHYACDFGSTVSCLEFAGGNPEWPWRAQMAFLRGASRQFGVPMYTYLAYIAGLGQPSSDPATWSGGWGLDFGIAPSTSQRLFFLGYYGGNNYIVSECGMRGLVQFDKSGKASYTGNGRAAKSVYEWSRRPEGARGEAYAPIVLLSGRRDGYDRPVRMRPSAFYGFYPLTTQYVFMDWVLQCLSPYHGRQEHDIPDVGAYMRNSPLGDIVDVFQADPLVHGCVKAGQLDPYAVAIVAGDMDFTPELTGELLKYVEAGGTLVLPDGDILPSGSEPAKVAGFDFVTCERRGSGRVLRFVEPWLATRGGKDRSPPAELERFLLALQDDVLPFKVSGDCECAYNILPDGTWKVLVMNNKGGGKKPDVTEEKIRPEYATRAKISLPAGATVREVRNGIRIAQDGSFDIPSCGVLVLEVKGVEAKRASNPVPEMFAEWTAENGMKESTGRYQLKFVNCAPSGGRFVLDQPGEQQAFLQPLVGNMPWDITEATFEAVATPAEKDRFPAPRNGQRRGPVFGMRGSGVVRWSMEYIDGRWVATSREGGNWRSVEGPEAPAGVKAHLAVVVKDGFLRFYVDGKEYLSPFGPIKFSDPEVRDSFYRMFEASIGTSLAAWGWFFKGEIHEVRAFSRAMSPEEIAERSRRALGVTP